MSQGTNVVDAAREIALARQDLERSRTASAEPHGSLDHLDRRLASRLLDSAFGDRGRSGEARVWGTVAGEGARWTASPPSGRGGRRLTGELPPDGTDSEDGSWLVVADAPDGSRILALVSDPPTEPTGTVSCTADDELDPEAAESQIARHVLIQQLHLAVLAVDIADDYLKHVVRWLSGRRGYGGPLLDHQVLRARLTRAFIEHRAARLALDETARMTPGANPDPLCATAVQAAVASVRLCEEVHAGAGVFDVRPDVVHRIALRQRRYHTTTSTARESWPGPLARLRPHPADQLDALIRSGREPSGPGRAEGAPHTTAEARRIATALDASLPVVSTSLLDELVVAEALAQRLETGLAARVMTHRQVVRSYVTDGSTWAKRVARGALVGVAVTEPGVGSDLSGLTTTLREDGPRQLLAGVKTYVAGGADSDLLVVAARRGTDTVLAWVDPRRPEVIRRPLSGRAWRGVRFAEVELRDYPVAPEDLLPGDGTTTLLTGLVQERLILAAQQLAYARAWTEELAPSLRTEMTWRVAAAQLLLEAAWRNAIADVPHLVDSSMAKIACCAVAADVATVRAGPAIALRTEPHPPHTTLLDDQASARACRFAGGSEDINLAIVEGSILSLLPLLDGGSV